MTSTDDVQPMNKPVPLALSELKRPLWSTRTTIRFGQCDPAGIVYTPNFFDIFNVAVEQWYGDALGIDYYDLIRNRRTGLGYVNAFADFFLPCRMGDELDIAVDVARIGNTSFGLILHAFREEHEALRGRLAVVTTSLVSHRPVPIPDDLRRALAAYSQR